MCQRNTDAGVTWFFPCNTDAGGTWSPQYNTDVSRLFVILHEKHLKKIYKTCFSLCHMVYNEVHKHGRVVFIVLLIGWHENHMLFYCLFLILTHFCLICKVSM